MKNSRIGLKKGFFELCNALKLSLEVAESLSNALELKTIHDEISDGTLTYVQNVDIISGIKISSGAIVLAPKRDKIVRSSFLIFVDNPEFVFWSIFEFLEINKENNIKTCANYFLQGRILSNPKQTNQCFSVIYSNIFIVIF